MQETSHQFHFVVFHNLMLMLRTPSAPHPAACSTYVPPSCTLSQLEWCVILSQNFGKRRDINPKQSHLRITEFIRRSRSLPYGPVTPYMYCDIHCDLQRQWIVCAKATAVLFVLASKSTCLHLDVRPLSADGGSTKRSSFLVLQHVYHTVVVSTWGISIRTHTILTVIAKL